MTDVSVRTPDESSFKTLLFGDEARREILAGVNVIADAVRVTLGPMGRNAIIVSQEGPPVVTKDGVTVARCIRLSDTFKDLGVQMVKEAASRTNDVAGDGTTTATVLTQAIYAEGVKLAAAGYAPPVIRAGIDLAAEAIADAILQMARPISSRDDLVHVGTISSNGDRSLGEKIAEAITAVGRDGSLRVEESRGFETVLDITEGLQFDAGFISPYFITSHERFEAELAEPLVLLTTRRVTTSADVLPVLEIAHKMGRPLLIVAEDVESDALQALTVNKLRGSVQACAVRAPLFGQHRAEVMGDLAAATGASIVSHESGLILSKVTYESLGTCSLASVGKQSTVLIGARVGQQELAERANSVRQRLADPSTQESDREYLRTRLARLSGGIAVIRVGGATAVEAKERRDRVDDAVSAVRAAIESGVVPGGGVALAVAATNVDVPDGPMRPGFEAVRRACEAPIRQIVENAAGEPAIVLAAVRAAHAAGERSMGHDAISGRTVDMMLSGIMDPAKVTVTALRNAASVAGLLLTVEVAIAVSQ